MSNFVGVYAAKAGNNLRLVLPTAVPAVADRITYRTIRCQATVGTPGPSASGAVSSFADRLLGSLHDDVGPNPTVLEAQAKVCTGPTQSKPLDEQALSRVLELILQSGKVKPQQENERLRTEVFARLCVGLCARSVLLFHQCC